MRGDRMQWKVSGMKRTPNGVFVELEVVDGDGWLKMYVSPEAVDAFRFDTVYEIDVREA